MDFSHLPSPKGVWPFFFFLLFALLGSLEEPQEEAPTPAEEESALGEEEPPPAPAAPPTKTGTVNARILNVRRGPDLKAEKIGILPRGERVLILGEEAGWYHIKAYAGYLEGWAAKMYIDVSPAEEPASLSSLPSYLPSNPDVP